MRDLLLRFELRRISAVASVSCDLEGWQDYSEVLLEVVAAA